MNYSQRTQNLGGVAVVVRNFSKNDGEIAEKSDGSAEPGKIGHMVAASQLMNSAVNSGNL